MPCRTVQVAGHLARQVVGSSTTIAEAPPQVRTGVALLVCKMQVGRLAGRRLCHPPQQLPLCDCSTRSPWLASGRVGCQGVGDMCVEEVTSVFCDDLE